MRVIISGLEGVGKTTLCNELARRGYKVIGEGIEKVMDWYRKQNEKNEKTTWEAIERAEDVKLIEEWLFFQKVPEIVHNPDAVFDRGLIDIIFYMSEDGPYWRVYAQKYVEFLRVLRRSIEETVWVYIPVVKEIWENSKLDSRHNRRPSHLKFTWGQMLEREEWFLILYKSFQIEPVILSQKTLKERADFLEKYLLPQKAFIEIEEG